MYKIRVEPKQQKLRPYCGMTVCLLMKDGSYKIGYLSACHKGSVVLNGNPYADHAHIASVRKARHKVKKQQARPRQPQLSLAPQYAASELALGGLQVGPIHLGPLTMQPPQPTKVPLQAIGSVLIL